jgi:hypothetical protein
VLSGTLAGAATGALLGLLGSSIGVDERAALATLLALVALAAGVRELRGGRACVIQRDAETPQRWLHRGPVVWAVLNGAALGSAFGTRLGFGLWYAVPLGALVLGDPAVGAALYGLYGAARTGAVLGIVMLDRSWGPERVADTLFALRTSMERLSGSALLGLGAVIAIAAGV